jgi:hypothetical protein
VTLEREKGKKNLAVIVTYYRDYSQLIVTVASRLLSCLPLSFLAEAGLFSVFSFWWDWSLNSGLCTCYAGAHWLSFSSNSFCSGYFRDRVLFFDQASLDHDLSVLCFPLLLGWWACYVASSFFLFEVVSREVFLPTLAWNHDLPNCRFPDSWDDKCVPLHPAWWHGVFLHFAQAGFEPWSLILASQIIRITGRSYWCLACGCFYSPFLLFFKRSLSSPGLTQYCLEKNTDNLLS